MNFVRDRSNSSTSWIEVPVPNGVDFSDRRGSTVSSISMESSGTFGSYVSPKTPSEAPSFGFPFERYKPAAEHIRLIQDLDFSIYEDLTTAIELQPHDVTEPWLSSNFLVSSTRQAHTLKPSPLPNVCKSEGVNLSAREYQLPSEAHEALLSTSDASYAPVSITTPSSESYGHVLWSTHTFGGHGPGDPPEQNDGSMQGTLGHLSYDDHFNWQGQMELERKTVAPADMIACEYTDCVAGSVKEEPEDVKLSHTSDAAGDGDVHMPTARSKRQFAKTPRRLTVYESHKDVDQPAEIIGLDGKPQYVCGMICKFPPNKDLTKETHIELIGGDVFCTKAFARKEHRTRHQISDRHKPTTREGEGLYCPLPECSKSREKCFDKDGKLPFAGNRKDNLDEHIVNTHCRAATHSNRNHRVETYEEACIYGWQDQWRRAKDYEARDALRNILTAHRYKRHDAARACLVHVFKENIIWHEDKFYGYLRQRGKFDSKLVDCVVQAIMTAYKRNNIVPPKESRRGNRKKSHPVKGCTSRNR